MATGGDGHDDRSSALLLSYRIKVTQVIDPHNFHAQLGYIEDFAKFTEFEDAITKYCEGQPILSVCESPPYLRDVVFTKPETGSWRRSVVASVFVDAGEVDVFHMDYGTTEIVSHVISPIPDIFSSPVPRAVRCKLAGVAPISKSWITRAVTSFQSLVKDRLLCAELLAEDNGVYSVNIYLDQGMTVRQTMVDNGLAQPVDLKANESIVVVDEFDFVCPLQPLSGSGEGNLHPLIVKESASAGYDGDLGRQTMEVFSPNATVPSSPRVEDSDIRALLPDTFFNPLSAQPQRQTSEVNLAEALESIGLDVSELPAILGGGDPYPMGEEAHENVSKIQSEIDQLNKRHYTKEEDPRLEKLKTGSPKNRSNTSSPSRSSPFHHLEFSPLSRTINQSFSPSGKGSLTPEGSMSPNRQSPVRKGGQHSQEIPRGTIAGAGSRTTEELKLSFCRDINLLVDNMTISSLSDCILRIKQLIFPETGSQFNTSSGVNEMSLVLECLTDKAVMQMEFRDMYQRVLQQLQDCSNFAENFVKVLKKVQSKYVQVGLSSKLTLSVAELLGSLYMWSEDWCQPSHDAVQQHVMAVLDIWVIFNRRQHHPDPDDLQALYTDCLTTVFTIAGSTMYKYKKLEVDEMFDVELTNKLCSSNLSESNKKKLLNLLTMKHSWVNNQVTSAPVVPSSSFDDPPAHQEVNTEVVDIQGEDVVVESDDVDDGVEDEYVKVKAMLRELKMMHLYEKFEENCIRDQLLDVDFADLKEILKECGFKIGQITEIKLYLKKKSAESATKSSPQVLIPPAQFECTSHTSLPITPQERSPSSTDLAVTNDIFKQQKDDLSTYFLPSTSAYAVDPSFSLPSNTYSYSLSDTADQITFSNSLFSYTPDPDLSVDMPENFQRTLWSDSFNCPMFAAGGEPLPTVPVSCAGNLTLFPDTTLDLQMPGVASQGESLMTDQFTLSSLAREEEPTSQELVSSLSRLVQDSPVTSCVGELSAKLSQPDVDQSASSGSAQEAFDPMSVFNCLFDSPKKDTSQFNKDGQSLKSIASSLIATNLFGEATATGQGSLHTPEPDWSFGVKKVTESAFPEGSDECSDQIVSKSLPAGSYSSPSLSQTSEASAGSPSYIDGTTGKKSTDEKPVKKDFFFDPLEFDNQTSVRSASSPWSDPAISPKATILKDQSNVSTKFTESYDFTPSFTTTNACSSAPWSRTAPTFPSSASKVQSTSSADSPWSRTAPTFPSSASKVQPTTSADFTPVFTTVHMKTASLKINPKIEEKVPSYRDAITAKPSGLKSDWAADRGQSKKTGMTVLGKVHHSSSNRNVQTKVKESDTRTPSTTRGSDSVKKSAAWDKIGSKKVAATSGRLLNEELKTKSKQNSDARPCFYRWTPEEVKRSTEATEGTEQAMHHDPQSSTAPTSTPASTAWSTPPTSQQSDLTGASSSTLLQTSGALEDKEANWWSPQQKSHSAPLDTTTRLEQDILKTFSKENYYAFDTSGSGDSSYTNETDDDFVIVENDNCAGEPPQEEFPALTSTTKVKTSKNKPITKSKVPAPAKAPPTLEAERVYSFGARRVCVLCGKDDHLSHQCPDRGEKLFFD